jgi:hypothetical protein
MSQNQTDKRRQSCPLQATRGEIRIKTSADCCSIRKRDGEDRGGADDALRRGGM